ncbi:MAG: recombination protein RecR [Candidatus Kerfeldbacteria bacterium]|nr:recombination protein RecR [Candidatus Kerfeldbacteria bacterium]
MSSRPAALEKLIAEFTKLPGIGPKAAERMVFHLLARPPEATDELTKAIAALREQIVRCSVCGTFDTQSPCATCSDRDRDATIICVVAEPSDIRAIEKTGEFKGRYHVLHGLLNPVEGITADDLSIQPLLDRVANDGVREVILALNPTVEGEATALYLKKALLPGRGRVTKLARGLPVGAEVDYADEITLGDALKGRREMS